MSDKVIQLDSEDYQVISNPKPKDLSDYNEKERKLLLAVGVGAITWFEFFEEWRKL